MEVARLQVAFEATGQAGVQRAVKQTDSDIKNLANNSVGAANRIGSAFGGAGKLIAGAFAAAAVVGIAKIGTGFLMANANAETLMTTMEIATGSISKANEVYGEMQKMAAATPFELPELVAGAARIEAFGISSVKVMGTIGDTAAGTMKSIDQVTAAYLDAGMGQFIRLQELGVDATVIGDQVELSYIKNGKKIVESVDKTNGLLIQSTLEGIWNDKYAGAMEKQSKTFNGMWSTLKDNFNLTMQDMTKGVFNFAKKGLKQANKFFDGFNKLRSQGVNPLRAAFMSLRQILTPGTDVSNFWSRLTESFESFVFAVGRGIGIVKDFVVGLFDAFKAGKSVEALANRLPDSLQGIAAAVFGIADAFGDLWRGFQQGGLSEVFSRLGDEARQIAAAGIDLGIIVVTALFDLASDVVKDLWGWFVARVMGTSGDSVWDGRSLEGLPAEREPVSVGTVFVTAALKLGDKIAQWAGNLWGWFREQIGAGQGGFVGVGDGTQMKEPLSVGDVFVDGLLKLSATLERWAGNLWGWVKDQLGVGPRGDGTDMSTGMIPLGDVLIDGVAKLGATLSGIAANVSAWLQEQIVGKSPTSIPVELANVAIRLLNPVADITSADISGWIQGRIDALTTVSAELHEWQLIIFGPDKVEAGAQAQEESKGRVQQIVDGWNNINAAMAWIAEMDPSPKVEMDERTIPNINNWLQDWVRGVQTISVPFSNWDIKLLAWRDIRWDAGFGDKGGSIADGIKGLVNAVAGVDVEFWNWKIKLLSPSEIKWGGGLGGKAMALVDWIGGEMRDVVPEIPLPSWNLKLQSPSEIVNSMGGDVAANVGLWITTALTAADAVTATLPSWDLHLDPPEFPDITGVIAVAGWINDAIDAVGEISASIVTWILNLDPPSINLSAGDVIGWVTDKVGELFPDGIHIPINVIFDLNMPGLKSGGVLSDIKNARQGGGDAMTFTATFTANIEAVERASNSAIMLGKSWADSSFEGALEATKEGVEKAFAASNVIGGSWDISQFTADFLVDASGVSSAFNSAVTIGNWWGDKVFTASFSVDTSGITNAVEVARQAAQAIADIMPHSPARKGPLREPISFAFIANDLIKHMGRMVPAAKSGIGSIAHYLGSLTTPSYGMAGSAIRSRASAGAYGGGGRGDTYIIHNPIMGNDARKWMQSQIAKGSARVVSGGIASSRVSEARH